MPIVGFNFTKIECEKKSQREGKINIGNNVSIKDIVETDISLGSDKNKALKFIFEFISKYEPNVGKILLEGEVLYLEEASKAKKMLEEWKKDKKIDRLLMANILNTVLNKCNIQALILSQDLNLPSPIPLPKVRVDATQISKKQ